MRSDEGAVRSTSSVDSNTEQRHHTDADALRFFNALASLQEADAFADYLAPVARAEWVVYAKPPFGGTGQVLAYLRRYTHRAAIANSRLLSLDDDEVVIDRKDYRHESKRKVMRLDQASSCAGSFCTSCRAASRGSVTTGCSPNRYREVKLARCRHLLMVPAPPPPLTEAEDHRGKQWHGRPHPYVHQRAKVEVSPTP